MKWLYLFLTTVIGETACQTLASNSECPMVDELLRKTSDEKTKLISEIANLRGNIEQLDRNLNHTEKLLRSILTRSQCPSFTFGLECQLCPCVKTNTEVCDYETGNCECKPGFHGESCNCETGKHHCNLTSSHCAYSKDGSPLCICRKGYPSSSGCRYSDLCGYLQGYCQADCTFQYVHRWNISLCSNEAYRCCAPDSIVKRMKEKQDSSTMTTMPKTTLPPFADMMTTESWNAISLERRRAGKG